MNLEFLKIDDKKTIESFGFVDKYRPGDFYLLKENDETIGYGLVFADDIEEKNKLDFYIISNKRGYGYGKYLFGKLLEQLKLRNYKDITLYIDNQNLIQKRLIIGAGGVLISCDRGRGKYIIPLV